MTIVCLMLLVMSLNQFSNILLLFIHDDEVAMMMVQQKYVAVCVVTTWSCAY